VPDNQPKKLLPPKYYLEYFKYLLAFVGRKYQHILLEAEKAFIRNFEQLSENEQCLYVRFSNRSGIYFRVEKLKYDEIDNLDYCLSQLLAKQFLHMPSSTFANEIHLLLDVYSKPELLIFCKKKGITAAGMSGFTKSEILEYILQVFDYEADILLLNGIAPTVRLSYEAEVQMLKFLFFGNRHSSMTEFVTRDLGYQRYEQYDEEKLVAQFATRQEAEDKLMVSLFAEKFYQIASLLSPDELHHWAVNWMVLHGKALSELAQGLLEHHKLKFGQFFEKIKEPEVAFDTYSLTELPPSRERRVRILAKLGHTNEANQLAESMLAEPYNNDEYMFAVDYQRKQKAKAEKTRNKRSVTLQLHDSESVTLPETWRNRVEAGIIAHYQSQGYSAVFAENHLWKSLFGLLFWDIIYDTEALAMHHPLQRAPSDIYKPVFYESRRPKIIQRLDILHDTDELTSYVQLIYQQKNGTTNPLVDWQQTTLEAVLAVLRHLSAFQLRAVLLEMAGNLKQNTHGFPDVFVWNTDTYHFIEVKSPTDNLSNQQLFWLQYFERIELQAKVLRVVWE
jgi:hypothetical protein